MSWKPSEYRRFVGTTLATVRQVARNNPARPDWVATVYGPQLATRSFHAAQEAQRWCDTFIANSHH